MKNSLQIQEEIDALALEGQSIYKAAEAANREMTDEEQSRFDEIAQTLVPALKKDKTKADEREAQHRALAAKQVRERQVEELNGSLSEAGSTQSHAITTQTKSEPRVALRTKRLRAFKNEKDAYDSGMWIRAMLNSDDSKAREHCHKVGFDIRTAGTEGSGATGGYLVPAPLQQTIIDIREMVGVMRQLLDVKTMTSDTLTIARRAGGLTVYSGEEAPSSNFTTSDKNWNSIELVARKRYVAHQISQELVDDALISIVDDAVREMGYALALREDQEAIDGDGTSSYTNVAGLKNNIGSAGIYTAGTGDDTWAELDITDFTGTMGKLPEEYWNQPGTVAWVCSANFYHDVMLRVLAQGGGNAIMELQNGDTGRRSFLGYPVFFTNRMPKATAASTIAAYFGNWQQLGTLGDRLGVRIARSEDFAFLQDLITLKATSRYDIQLYHLGDSTNAGAVVALRTAA